MHDQPPPSTPAISPVAANRAVLTYLLVQSGLLAALVMLGVPVTGALLVAGVLLLALITLAFRGAWASLRADPRWRTPPNLLTAALALILALLASRGLLLFIDSLLPGASSIAPQFAGLGVTFVLLLLAVGLLLPFAEEVVFRGYLLRSYEHRRGPLFASAASTLLFALAHGAPVQVIGLLPLAWVLARAVQATGSFWTAVVIHVLNNLLSLGVAGLLLSRPDLAGMLGTDTLVTLPLGLAGLAVAILTLWLASWWLRPRAPLPDGSGGRVWSGSLLIVLGVAAWALWNGAYLLWLREQWRNLP